MNNNYRPTGTPNLPPGPRLALTTEVHHRGFSVPEESTHESTLSRLSSGHCRVGLSVVRRFMRRFITILYLLRESNQIFAVQQYAERSKVRYYCYIRQQYSVLIGTTTVVPVYSCFLGVYINTLLCYMLSCHVCGTAPVLACCSSTEPNPSGRVQVTLEATTSRSHASAVNCWTIGAIEEAKLAIFSP